MILVNSLRMRMEVVELARGRRDVSNQWDPGSDRLL